MMMAQYVVVKFILLLGYQFKNNIGNVIFNQANFTIVKTNFLQDEPVYKKELFENDIIH